MEASVGMRKGMQGIVRIHTEMIGRDEYSTRGSERYVAFAFSYGSGSNSCSSIVTCTGYDFNRNRKSEFLSHIRSEGSHHLIAFKQFGHLLY